MNKRVTSLKAFFEDKLPSVHVAEATCMHCVHYEPQDYAFCGKKKCHEHSLFQEKRKRPVRQLMRQVDVVEHFVTLYGLKRK